MPTIDQDADILAIIDVQPTFMPGGELAVTDGEAVVGAINALTEGLFSHAVATQDWHPPGHISFASRHPGRAPFETITLPYGEQTLWPDHAVQGSPGAALHPGLDLRRVEAIIRKGFRPGIDSYSALFENDHATATGLEAWLRARGFRRVFVAGLALDFCVAWSAEDARRVGFDVIVIEDACRAIAAPLPEGGTTLDAARARLVAAGVAFARAADLTA